ncbi:hypothetical protein BOTBODRAFT_47656 [Botryobasidium botryosum FD-172 SS1]|uniref:Uncharacterized protein n=1 Tax=Botryobasidium botryosum (strain FD-172 SS1) TaxID=930990 RepID=A0A067M1H0_BOTB1|nr:hypothetical protein BOTBODRAFT_47656 [Botryobasidium botryosum FD-172 SS1]
MNVMIPPLTIFAPPIRTRVDRFPNNAIPLQLPISLQYNFFVLCVVVSGAVPLTTTRRISLDKYRIFRTEQAMSVGELMLNLTARLVDDNGVDCQARFNNQKGLKCKVAKHEQVSPGRCVIVIEAIPKSAWGKILWGWLRDLTKADPQRSVKAKL